MSLINVNGNSSSEKYANSIQLINNKCYLFEQIFLEFSLNLLCTEGVYMLQYLTPCASTLFSDWSPCSIGYDLQGTQVSGRSVTLFQQFAPQRRFPLLLQASSLDDNNVGSLRFFAPPICQLFYWLPSLFLGIILMPLDTYPQNRS